MIRRLSGWTALSMAGLAGASCLTRPISTQQPTVKTVFTAPVRQTAVNKIDLLFMIDNSESMGDKQELLRQAVPDLVTRLIQPNCVDMSGNILAQCTPDTSGDGKCNCAMGTLEFQPVHDMHVGIVSSSLGGGSSENCPANATNPVNPALNTHNDDRGELINRADPMANQTETPVPDAEPENFLAWFPPVDANIGGAATVDPAITAPATLTTDFQDLVSGVHQYGCGFEATDEAWYRFLVQPDPYDHVSRDQGECAGGATTGMLQPIACAVGIDQTILQQRSDFLRPDSLVAVIMVTDENSGQFTDPFSIGGEGWAFMSGNFPGGTGPAAMGTTACGPTMVMGPNPGPTDPACTSCGFATDPNVIADKAAGGNCSKGTPPGYYTLANDQLNVRGCQDKQRFGVDPEYPVTRYVTGLTQAKVPDQVGEHAGGNYVGNQDCDNPLYAANLPTQPGAPDANGHYPALCNLTHGPRTSSLIFLGAITGVPHQLLQQDPTNPDSPQKDSLTSADWVKIVGKDPLHFDFTGIDPHMFPSITPRPGLPPPGAGDGNDPDNGREWNTGGGDLQYACTFPLATPHDCTSAQYKVACDCAPGRCDTCANDPNCVCPPVCGDGTTNPLTTQVRAKAYPAARELQEVMLMADNGIVSSLCPIHPTLDPSNPTDPLYGYRPAVNAIVDRLKNALANQCLPQQLSAGGCGNVPCLVLETLATGTQADCSSGMYPGLVAPDPGVLSVFQAQQHAAWASNGGLDAGLGTDPATLPTCAVVQLVPQGSYDPSCTGANTNYQYVSDIPASGSCAASSEAGWCYVTGAAAGGSCAQSILFSPNGNPQVGAQINLQCIESAGSDAGASTD